MMLGKIEWGKLDHYGALHTLVVSSDEGKRRLRSENLGHGKKACYI